MANVVGRPTLAANIQITDDVANALWTEFGEVEPIKVRKLKDHRMLFWHLSGMSLTVWLTRNRPTKDIMAKTYALQQER